MSIVQIRHQWRGMAVLAAILSGMLCLTACSGSKEAEAFAPETGTQELSQNVTSLDTDEETAAEIALLAGVNISGAELPMSKSGAYLMDIYSLVLGKKGSLEEIGDWTADLESGGTDGSDLLWDLFNRDELEARNLGNREYVITCYQACLDREPEDDRLDYWTGRLEDGERRVFVLYQLLKTDECEAALAEHGIERGSVGAVSNAMQKNVASIARNNKGTRDAVTGECAAWVSGVYAAAGLGYPGGNAIDYWDWWKGSGSSDMSKVPVGAAVVGSGSRSSAGMTYGHIGIYIGDGLIAHNAGGGVATISSIEEFENDYCNGNLSSCYYSAYKGKQGILGWVWPAGEDFSG